MNELEKLRVMIPHWIEHNQEHADEFQRWADAAGDAAADILDASVTMSHVNQSLQVALEKLGGALPHNHLESNE